MSKGELSVGDLIVFVSYTRKASSPLRSFAREATKLAAAMARAERIAELLSTDDVIEERPNAYHGPRAQGEIAIEHVSFAYSGERPALEDVSVAIPAGKRLALTGPSGAGKSTLSALIARFYDPTEGRVLIDGRDARDCSLAWLRDQVAVVLQDTVLFTGSVRENISYGVDATDEEIVDAAKAAAAHEFIRRLPDGYDTQLGPQGVGLSGGQRQRIGIARTLLRNPPIIILDEPTTALDRESEAQVLEGLDRLMRGRTCILITHSPRLVRTADLVIELDGGRVVRDRDARTPARPYERLLDPDVARAILERSLGPGERLGDIAVARVYYRPDGADARALPRGRRRRRADRRARRRCARRSPPTTPARTSTITWLPFDPRLPALAEHPDELARKLDLDLDGEPILLRYKPRARAVLRWGEHVLKAYGSRGVVRRPR